MATKTRTAKPSTTANPTEVMTAGADIMRENIEKAANSYGTFAAFSKESLEAWFQAVSAMRKGMETINSETMAYSRQSVDEAVANMKTAMTAKSVEEYYALQTDFAKTALDGYVNQTSRIGEVVSETVRDVWGHIQTPAQTIATANQDNAQAASA